MSNPVPPVPDDLPDLAASTNHEESFRATFRLRDDLADDPLAIAAFDYAASHKLKPQEMAYIGAAVVRREAVRDEPAPEKPGIDLTPYYDLPVEKPSGEAQPGAQAGGDVTVLESNMGVQHLKIWPKYFAAVERGTKTFEIRANDRPFMIGQKLVLHEYDPEEGQFSGRTLERFVSYMTDYEQKPGFLVMGLAMPTPPAAPPPNMNKSLGLHYYDAQANRLKPVPPPSPEKCPHCVQGYIHETGFQPCNHCNATTPETGTPETDAWAIRTQCKGSRLNVPIGFARQLERRLAAAQREAVGLRNLRQFATHRPLCMSLGGTSWPCDCGYDKAIADLVGKSLDGVTQDVTQSA